MANRVTKQYPDPGTDWRGIAMLTQQMSELFKPSKSRLLSQQQEHEMQMLQAKQAWEFGSEQLEQNKLLYQKAVKDLDTAQDKLNDLSPEIMKASFLDGAIPENASKMLDDTQGRSVRDVMDAAKKYHNETLRIQKNLDSMGELDRTVNAGEKWGTKTKMISKHPETGEVIDYYKEANVDGVPKLSFEERENAVRSFIVDNYSVGEEEESVEMTFGSGDKAETIMVAPEAVAFRVGFESSIGTDTGRGKLETDKISALNSKIKAQVEAEKGKTPGGMSPEELIASIQYNQGVINDIDANRTDSFKNYPLGVYLEKDDDGNFVATEKFKMGSFKLGDRNLEFHDVIKYSTAYTNYTKGMKELQLRGLDLPKISTAKYSPDVLTDFSTYGTHPDSLKSQVLASDNKDITNAYAHFEKTMEEKTPAERRAAIVSYQNWLSK